MKFYKIFFNDFTDNINYILDKGNSIQKNFILDKFHDFDHAKKLIFDKDKKVSEKSFFVLMEDDNRELFKEKLNNWFYERN